MKTLILLKVCFIIESYEYICCCASYINVSALSIVRVRAKAMHDASIDPPSGMIGVRGLPMPKVCNYQIEIIVHSEANIFH